MRTPHSRNFSLLAIAAVMALASLGAVAAPPSAGAAPLAPATEQAKGAVKKYTLETGIINGKMVFIDDRGQANPVLRANVGDTVEIRLKSGEGAQHDIAIPELKVQSQ